MLPVLEWGSGPAVGLVHGFTQSAASWAGVAERLAGRWHLVAVDAPGHGRAAAVAADLVTGAAMIGDTVGAASYVGYSMGGRFALHLALSRPDLVRALVLVSTSAGIDGDEERSARRASDERLAARVEAEGVEAFVAWWLTTPLFATLAPESAEVGSRLGGSAAGLASSLRRAGAGTQVPLWDRLGALDMPVLVVAGSRDSVYCARARRLAAAIGSSATLHLVAGAGHACHLERPDDFCQVLAGWLPAT